MYELEEHMKRFFEIKDVPNDEFEDENLTFLNEPSIPFKLHQSYEKSGDTKQIICKCGCKKFEVGQGSFFTVLRCLKCNIEQCVHDG
jgi:hypothetical protein